MRAAAIAVVALVALTVLVASVARAELEDGVFTSLEWRIEMEAPSKWQPTESTAYPNVLLWIERRDPSGVMLLAAERVDSELDSLQYAKQTAVRLEKMGFLTRPPQLHTTTGAALVDFESETSFLRQAFLVKGSIGYSLTLAADSSRVRGLHLRAFDGALRSIKPLRTIKPIRTEASPAAPSPTP